MKKHFRILVGSLVFMVATTLAGQGIDMSAGAGLVVAPEWGQVTVSGCGMEFVLTDFSQVATGVQAFFDATYAQMRFGYLFGGQRNVEVALDPTEPVDWSGTYDYSILEISAFGNIRLE